MIKTARQRFYYIIADFLSANVAWFVFNIIRYFTLPYNHNSMTMAQYMSLTIVILGQLLFPIMMVLLYAVSGYYNRVFFKSRLDDVLNSLAVSMCGAVIIFFLVLFNDQIDDRLGNIETIITLWLILSVMAMVPRLIITNHTKADILARKIAFNALIIGNTQRAHDLARDLETKHRNMGFKILGVEDGWSENLLDKYSEIDAFIISPDSSPVEQTVATINKLLPTMKRVYVTPNAMHLLTSRPRTEMVAGQVLIDVSTAGIPASTVNLKRLGDIAMSSVALVALLPIMAVIAMFVKSDSLGPVIYKQERIGYKKRPFNIYKFRTMRTDAEKDGPALSAADDERITRVGRILRKYRLDELPQFWNVLRGDMSLVGPRPERQFFLNQIIQRAPYYNIIHQVRPGITSWGMVKYGYASNVDQMIERLKYDIIYVENVSFAVDLKILFYTIRTVLTGKGI